MYTLQNGLDYEKYTHNIIKDKYLNCWLWNDTPNDILLELGFKFNCDDIGCDIVCQIMIYLLFLFNVKIILLLDVIILFLFMIFLVSIAA